MTLGKVCDVLSEQPLQSLLATVAKDSVLKSVLGKVVSDEVTKRLVSDNKSVTVTIKERLTTSQENCVLLNYPEYDIKFVPSSTNSHGIAAVFRRLSNRVLLDRIEYFSKDVYTRNQYNRQYNKAAYVKDFGGNFSYYLRNSMDSVHCCCPELSTKDSARHVDRIKTSRNIVHPTEVQMAMIRDLNSCNEDKKRITPSLCRHRSQNCTLKSDYVIMQDSSYDYPLVNLADALVLSNSLVCFGSFIFTPEIMIKSKGRIESLGVEWEHLDSNKISIYRPSDISLDNHFDGMSYIMSKSKFIRFTFLGCASSNYTHRTDVYLSYVMVTKFHDSTGRHNFCIERMENRDGYQFYKIQPVEGADSLASISCWINSERFDHDLWLGYCKDKYVISLYDLDSEAVNDSISKVFPDDPSVRESLMLSRRFLAPKYLVERGLDYAKGVTEAKYKPEEIFNFLKGVNSRIPSGTSIKRPNDSLNSYELKILSIAVYVKVYDEKYRTGKVLQQLLSDINYNRNIGSGVGVFARLVNVVSLGYLCSSQPPNKLRRNDCLTFLGKYAANNSSKFRPQDVITTAELSIHMATKYNDCVNRLYKTINGELVSIVLPSVEYGVQCDVFDRMMFRVYGLRSNRDNVKIGDGLKDVTLLGVVSDVLSPVNDRGYYLVNEFTGESYVITNSDLDFGEYEIGTVCVPEICEDISDVGTQCTSVDQAYIDRELALFELNTIRQQTDMNRTVPKRCCTDSTALYVDYPTGTSLPKNSSVITNNKAIVNRLNSDFNYNLNHEESFDLVQNKIFDGSIDYVYYYFNPEAILEEFKNMCIDDIRLENIGKSVLVSRIFQLVSIGMVRNFYLVVPYNLESLELRVLGLMFRSLAVLEFFRNSDPKDNYSDYYFKIRFERYVDLSKLEELLAYYKNNVPYVNQILLDKILESVVSESSSGVTIVESPASIPSDSTGTDPKETDRMTTTIGNHLVSYVPEVESNVSLEEVVSIGDGNCLFRSMTEHRKCDFVELRKNLYNIDTTDEDLRDETVSGAWGGSRAIEAFCAIYHMCIRINSSDGNNVAVHSNENYVRPISIKYSESHYNFLRQPCLNQNDIIDPVIELMYEPLDLGALTVWLYDRGLTPNSYPCLVSWCKTPTEGFVNNLFVYCNQHIRCRNNNFRVVLDNVLSHSLKDVICIFELKNFDFTLLNAADYNHIQFVVLPKKFMGYFCIRFSSDVLRSTILTVDVDLLLSCCTDAFMDPRVVANGVVSYCRCSRTKEGILNSIKLDSLIDNEQRVVTNGGNITVLVERGKSRRLLKDPSVTSDFVCDIVGKYSFDRLELDFNGFINVDVICRKMKRVYGNVINFIDTYKDVEFCPQYVTGIDAQHNIINSMEEVRWMWRQGVSSVISNITADHQMGVLFANCGGVVPSFSVSDYGMIDMNVREWVVRPKDSLTYDAAFNGTILINISGLIVNGVVSRTVSYTGERFLSVSKETVLINYDKFCANTDKYILDSKKINFKITIIEGAPGVGKTEYILNRHNNETDMVLTSTREAANDLRVRATRKLKLDLDPKSLDQTYRTVDSLIIHGLKPKSRTVDVLWIDEGFMRHCGDWFWCALITKCKELRVVGDSAQIPFIERQGLAHYYSDYTLVCNDMVTKEKLDLSRRCPADVVVWLNSNNSYSFKVKTNNSIKNSVEHVRIVTDTSLPPEIRDTAILVFTQAEKSQLREKGYQAVTVHEYQGNQAKHVSLIRLNAKEIPVYKSLPHLLVALTRHTEKFVYYTVIPDSIVEAIDTIKTYGNNELQMVQQISKVGGGVQYVTFEERPLEGDVLFNNDRAVVMYLQESSLRDFVQLNGETGYIPSRPKYVSYPVEELCKTIEPSPLPIYDCNNKILVLQEFLDATIPGSTVEFDAYDQYLLHLEFCDYHHSDLNIRTDYTVYNHESEFMTPVLRSHAPRPTSNTQEALLKAYLERNGMVPELAYLTDVDAESTDMVKSFVSAYVDDVELLSQFSTNKLNINVVSLRNWLFNQPPSVEKLIASSDLSVYLRDDLNVYDYVLKRSAKIDMEINAHLKFKSPQTIAFQSKEINAVFCPIVKDVKERLLSVLNLRTIINSDMSPDDFERKLTYIMNRQFPTSSPNHLEIDFSKFDKSQNKLALTYEVKMLYMLGFPVELLELWIYQHRFSVLINRNKKFKAYVEYQRKSGDALTFLGNTMFLMAVMARLFGLHNRKNDVFLFSGDDSIIFTDNRWSDDTIDEAVNDAGNVYNLEIKLLTYKYPYFCSKFIICYDDYWFFVPDVLKLVIKLGRKDLVNQDHVELYRISFNDNINNLKYYQLHGVLSEAHKNRYPTMFDDISFVINALVGLSSNIAEFNNLYTLNTEAIPVKYTTLPSLDI